MIEKTEPEQYARETLERYTGCSIGEFSAYVLLVNFPRYIEKFSEITGAPIKSGYWTVVHDSTRNISIINFGVGSPSAGIIAHCLSCVPQVESVIMLGMCGGIDEQLEIGGLLIPTASVRDEGTSRHYLPQDVPAQPSFWINRLMEEVIRRETGRDPKTGIMLTTDYRMWEFDDEFISYLLKHRILAIDMEIATLFAVAYARNLPIGAIMLISDLPLQTGGIKSKQSAREIFQNYTENHLHLGIMSIEAIKQNPDRCKTGKIKSEW